MFNEKHPNDRGAADRPAVRDPGGSTRRPNGTPIPPAGFGPAYDAAHETVLHGTIKEVVTKHAIGTPAGIHLLVAGPQGVVDAHLGPFLSKETKEALQTGTSVWIAGATLSLHGKQYFLARQLNVNGHTVTIRNARGFLVHPDDGSTAKIGKTALFELNGGAR